MINWVTVGVGIACFVLGTVLLMFWKQYDRWSLRQVAKVRGEEAAERLRSGGSRFTRVVLPALVMLVLGVLAVVLGLNGLGPA